MEAAKPGATDDGGARRRGDLARPHGSWWGANRQHFLVALGGALLCCALLLAGVARGVSSSATSGGSYAAPCSLTRQVAYVAGNYASQKGIVWLAAANGSGRKRLFRAATPALAPSGRLIAVTEIGHSAGLGIFTVCGSRLGQYFSSRDAISGVVWSPDSTLVAAIVDPHPGQFQPDQRLVVIDVATGQLTTVATGYFGLAGAGPSFSLTSPYSLTYAVAPSAGADRNVWSAAIGQPGTQLTRNGSNAYPLWGPQGILYQAVSASSFELKLFSNGHSIRLMNLPGVWAVALSSDGLHLATEGVACGYVYASSVNLAKRKIVHQFPVNFAPFGITASGRSLLLDGSPPTGPFCGSRRSVIESVPFAGGKPKVIAYGTSASWAGSPGTNVVWP